MRKRITKTMPSDLPRKSRTRFGARDINPSKPLDLGTPEIRSNVSSTQGTTLRAQWRAYTAAHRWALLGTAAQFRRMPFTTALTCVALGIALAFPAVLFVLLQNVQQVTARWDGATQISLYLKTSTSETQALKLAEQLRAQSDIGKVEYVSKARALEDFQRYSGLGDALALLGENPLPPVLVIHPKDGQIKPDAVDRMVRTLKTNSAVDVAQWDMQWLQRLHGLISVGQRAILVIGTLLLVAALVVVGNTIRLAVQNRTQEIKVTKLIGASDAFVRRPFLYSGFCYGLVGGLFAIAVVSCVLWALNDPVRAVAISYSSNFILRGLGFELSALLLTAGISLGLIGSWLSVSRHLRAIEPGVA